ncbi:hypothetical protein ACF0H5_023103 [Mactra antiquata]
MSEEVSLRQNDRFTRIVSDEFKFLNVEDTDDRLSGHLRDSHDLNNGKADTIPNGFTNDSEHKYLKDTNIDKVELNNKRNNEFTIVTEVMNDKPDSNQNTVPGSTSNDKVNHESSITNAAGNIDRDRSGSQFLNINPVYEVSEEDSISLIESDKLANSRRGSEAGSTITDDSIKDEPRRSIIIEGEVVELRKSLADRQSRVATWKKNQKFVSEAFEFLKDEEFQIDDEGRLSQLNDSINDSVIEKNIESYGAETENNVCKLCEKDVNGLDNVIDGESESKGSEQNCQCNTNSKAMEMNGNDDSGVYSEQDCLSDLPNKINRRRKYTHQSSSESGEDDGDSSDEDAGLYRESFRKSTWLYVGDNEEIKVGHHSNYVSIADLGVKTCDDDEIFGHGPDEFEGIHLQQKLLGHQRKDSTATTASENEFRNEFKSVSRRFVKRADSQQEYKRMTTRSFDNVKVVTLKRDSNTEYGIHILDCKPAVISRVDPGSPSEIGGLRQGHILTSINGVNVLDVDHDEIIRLVQQDTSTLTVEVGCGDTSAVHDLQEPVHTGYLQKQTSTIFRTWKKRFFILRRDNCLYYYKNEKEVDPLGAIPLGGYTFSRYGDHTKFGFKAEKFNAKTFYFLADSRPNMTEWVGVLSEAARSIQGKDSWMDVTASNVGLPALNIRNPDCSGYLYKLGRATRRWRKRYCVLKDACIYYYKNTSSKEADGVAHLHGYTVDPSGVSGKKFSFSLQPPEIQMRVFSFYTDNDTDKLRWVESLNTSIQKWVKVD